VPVLVSYGCLNKFQQTYWFKTTVLEATEINQGLSRAILPVKILRENLLIASYTSVGSKNFWFVTFLYSLPLTVSLHSGRGKAALVPLL
jgi:hypothetical protein